MISGALGCLGRLQTLPAEGACGKEPRPKTVMGAEKSVPKAPTRQSVPVDKILMPRSRGKKKPARRIASADRLFLSFDCAAAKRSRWEKRGDLSVLLH
jgi:hypothetical protein